ncbi:hypothetical protein AK88_05359 [Plasmodium fragile]|uniref:Uncharacterized protein n=1 Tax=Plasmodium fragile TaxID=5857 RepID=A0A0D9QDE9_PLAFR|nr:uncharacterized protein AK88_05359 [Plasmodium fragile]KJP85004.1 hypothetical protein AK88_05359 [Plasmodium fragile]
MTFLVKLSISILVLCLWQIADGASTLGTSSGNGTSPYDTVDASTVGTTTVSLSDGTDVGTRGTRNFYDGHATASPAKNTVFDDMRRNFKSKVKVQKPNHVKKSSQDITAGNNCRRGLKTLIRCKMGRKAWTILIVISTVLYAFFMTIIQPFSNEPQTGIILLLSTLGSIHGTALLIASMYLCVLVCFLRSKTAKCLFDKFWKKKEKEEAPTETKNNEGELNNKPEIPGKQHAPKKAGESQKPQVPEKKESSGKLDAPRKPDASNKTEVPQKQETPKKPEVPNKQEASGILEVPNKPETPGKSDVPQKQETPNKPEVSNKTEVPGTTEVPNKPEVRAKAQVPQKPEVLVKPESCGKSEVPKKADVLTKRKAPVKLKLPWSLKLAGKP